MLIRPMKQEEYFLLEEFLYQAIFVPEGAKQPDRAILQLPELQHYFSDFGTKAGDVAWVAEVDGQVVGVAWVRHIRDYGYVDDQTPSLSIALLEGYRGQGLGSRLLQALFADLKSRQVQRLSLSVSKENPAHFLYRKLGFRILRENETDFVMVLEL